MTISTHPLLQLITDDTSPARERLRDLVANRGSSLPTLQLCEDAMLGLTEVSAADRVVFLFDAELLSRGAFAWLSMLRDADFGPVLLVGEASKRLHPLPEGISCWLDTEELERGSTLLSDHLNTIAMLHSERQLRSRIDPSERIASIAQADPEGTYRMERLVRDSLHEFRTPLTAVKEFTSMMLDGLSGEITEKQGEYLNYVLSATETLLVHFDDFRDSLRLRLGSLPHECDTCDVQELLSAAVHPAPSTRASFHVQVAPDVSSVFADKAQVKRALRRILGHAAKTCPRDTEIHVAATREDSDVLFNITWSGPPATSGDSRLLREDPPGDPIYDKSITKVFGVGVELARVLLLREGADLELCTGAGPGSQLIFKLPCQAKSETHPIGALCFKPVPNLGDS